MTGSREITEQDIRALKPLYEAAKRGEIPETISCTCGQDPRDSYRRMCGCGVYLKPGIRTMEPRRTIISSWEDMAHAWRMRLAPESRKVFAASAILERCYDDLTVRAQWAEGLEGS